MKLNLNFAVELKSKLTDGNTTSILLNALPGKSSGRLALDELNKVRNGLSKDFITTLTSKPSFTIKFSFEDLINKLDIKIAKLESDGLEYKAVKSEKARLATINNRLSTMKFDHDDYEKEHGVPTFGFGFPIFSRPHPRDNSKTIYAPVFIFPLNIKQSYDKAREWVISKDADAEIRLNESLCAFFENEEHIKLPLIQESMLEDGILDVTEIEQYCSQLLERFEIDNTIDFDWKNFVDFAVAKDEESNKSTKILWNGVFGLYKSHKQNHIKEIEALIQNFDELTSDVENLPWDNCHSPMLTDPSQNGVIRSLSNESNLVIQGPPGTGKSQTLTAIIASAIANGKKVLVVCEKKTALDVLRSNLISLIPETKSSIALIEDLSRDRGPIVETVRNRTAKYLQDQHVLSNLNGDIGRFEKTAEHVNQHYEALRHPIIDNRRWSTLVSKWMKRIKSADEIESLDQFYKLIKSFSLNQNSIADIKIKIEGGKDLYTKVKPNLVTLSSKINTLDEISDRYAKELLDTLKECKNTLQRLQKSFKDERITISNHFRSVKTEEISDKLASLNSVAKLVQQYKGENLDIFNPTFLFKFLSIFISKYRQGLNDANSIKTDIARLMPFWKEVFSTQLSLTTIDDCILLAEKQREQVVSDFVLSWDNATYNNILSSSFKTENLQIAFGDLKSQIQLICKHINVSVADIMACSQIELVQVIENLILKIDDVLKLSFDVDYYFKWQLYFRRLDEASQKMITLLMDSDVEVWATIVDDAWLYTSLVDNDIEGKFPVDDSNIRILNSTRKSIEHQQKELIKIELNNSFLRGQQKITEQGLQINSLYNLRGPKGGTRNSLRNIIKANFEAFIDFFPVLMVNPDTCTSILPFRRGLFDLVIFDEASQLRIEDTYTILLRGKQVVVSGDSQQMPPSSYFTSSSYQLLEQDEEEDIDEDDIKALEKRIINDDSLNAAHSESLLQYAIDRRYRETYLDMHYRSKHPDLIQFSNTCFYRGRLIPMPATMDDVPIIYRNLKGLYENRENKDEAEEIIRLLKEEIDSKFSVGVATFNINQRNLILRRISEERSNDPEFNSKMLEFDKNEFFVKNLENIQGDERDIIIISTTFGDSRGKPMSLRFGPISQKNGHRLLNVIITRAKYRKYVITSIPEDRINKYQERLSESMQVNGTTGLFAYLAYAKAISEQRNDEKQGILKFIESKLIHNSSSSMSDDIGLTESPFEEEVYNWLSRVIDKDRLILQHKCGGFRIDMVVKPKNPKGKMLAIECDGAAFHSDILAWHHDMYRQEQLEKHGFVFHRIWSTNWWRHPEEEFQNLVNAISKM